MEVNYPPPTRLADAQLLEVGLLVSSITALYRPKAT